VSKTSGIKIEKRLKGLREKLIKRGQRPPRRKRK
jgi:hypothetical protein